MVYQKKILNNFYTKKWVYFLFKLLIKTGKKIRALFLLNKILLRVLKEKKFK